MSRFFPLLLALAFASVVNAAPIVREPGAIYLSDFGLKPLKLKVPEPAPGFEEPHCQCFERGVKIFKKTSCAPRRRLQY